MRHAGRTDSASLVTNVYYIIKRHPPEYSDEIANLGLVLYGSTWLPRTEQQFMSSRGGPVLCEHLDLKVASCFSRAHFMLLIEMWGA